MAENISDGVLWRISGNTYFRFRMYDKILYSIPRRQCSAWEGGEAQKSVIDKESIKDHLPDIQGREDYMVNRLDQEN